MAVLKQADPKNPQRDHSLGSTTPLVSGPSVKIRKDDTSAKSKFRGPEACGPCSPFSRRKVRKQGKAQARPGGLLPKVIIFSSCILLLINMTNGNFTGFKISNKLTPEDLQDQGLKPYNMHDKTEYHQLMERLKSDKECHDVPVQIDLKVSDKGINKANRTSSPPNMSKACEMYDIRTGYYNDISCDTPKVSLVCSTGSLPSDGRCQLSHAGPVCVLTDSMHSAYQQCKEFNGEIMPPGSDQKLYQRLSANGKRHFWVTSYYNFVLFNGSELRFYIRYAPGVDFGKECTEVVCGAVQCLVNTTSCEEEHPYKPYVHEAEPNKTSECDPRQPQTAPSDSKGVVIACIVLGVGFVVAVAVAVVVFVLYRNRHGCKKRTVPDRKKDYETKNGAPSSGLMEIEEPV